MEAYETAGTVWRGTGAIEGWEVDVDAEPISDMRCLVQYHHMPTTTRRDSPRLVGIHHAPPSICMPTTTRRHDSGHAR